MLFQLFFLDLLILLWIFTIIGLSLVFKKILNPKEEEQYIDKNIEKLHNYELCLIKNKCGNINEEIDYNRCQTRNKNINIKNCIKKTRQINNQIIKKSVMKSFCSN